MEEETITPHPNYVKGFNEGYIINQHMPEMSEQLAKAYGQSDRGMGFSDGWKQSLLEQIKDRSMEWGFDKDENAPTPNKLEDKDYDIEPDR